MNAKIAILAISIPCAAILGGFVGAQIKSMQANEFRVMNQDGQTAALLGVDDQGRGFLKLYDEKQREQIVLMLVNDDALPVLTMMNKDGAKSIQVGVQQHGFGFMFLKGGTDRNPESQIEIISSNKGSLIAIDNQQNKNLISLNALGDSGVVRTRNTTGKTTGSIGEN